MDSPSQASALIAVPGQLYLTVSRYVESLPNRQPIRLAENWQ